MPPIFKALTSISVWILFIHGLVAIVWGGLEMWVFGEGVAELTTKAVMSCGLGTANLLMAAAAAKLRDAML